LPSGVRDIYSSCVTILKTITRLIGIIGLASTLYNNFLPFLLASRGAKFGDSSYYITYRNVWLLSIHDTIPC
jgi:hypothetical protein